MAVQVTTLPRETFIVGKQYAKYKELLKDHDLEIFHAHIGHTIEFQEDSPFVLWIKCLNCDKLWTHCDFCKYGHRHGPLDFGCTKCN